MVETQTPLPGMRQMRVIQSGRKTYWLDARLPALRPVDRPWVQIELPSSFMSVDDHSPHADHHVKTCLRCGDMVIVAESTAPARQRCARCGARLE